jgi:hypothetical protein
MRGIIKQLHFILPGPVIRLLATLLILGLVAGCGSTPPIDFGRPAPVDGFAKLRPGISTSNDVRALLGRPAGDGASRHVGQENIRTLWFYEYGRIKDDKIALKIILVFFNDDIYEGHMWFSSKELIKLDWS